MTRGWKSAVLLGLGLCALYAFPVFADDWEVYVPDSEEVVVSPDRVDSYSAPFIEDDEWDDEIELINDLATGSDWRVVTATPSVVDDVAPIAQGYIPYDSAMSTSAVQFFKDYIDKIGGVHYVLFRSGQYTYRLVISPDLFVDGSSFSAPDADYVTYDTRYYTWSTGHEGAFSLKAGNYLVYSDVGDYPVLTSGSLVLWIIVFLGTVVFLFNVIRVLFAPHRMSL